MPLAHDKVSFDELVSHRFGSSAERAAFEEMYRTFEAQHGAIVDEYWCSTVRGAVALTERMEIFCCHERTDVPGYNGLSQRLRRSVMLGARAHRMLRGRDLKSTQLILFGAAKEGLDTLDELLRRQSEKGPQLNPDARAEALSRIDDDLAEGADGYHEAAQRAAQYQYLFGTLAASAAIGLCAGVAWVASSIVAFVPGAVPGIVAAGSAGALLIVLSRMSSGGLLLQPEAGIGMLRLLGGVRPAVGSIAGLALCVLAASGLVPLRVPSDPGDQTLFFVGMAFLAGFSERWAQDMLGLGQNRASTPPPTP